MKPTQMDKSTVVQAKGWTKRLSQAIFDLLADEKPRMAHVVAQEVKDTGFIIVVEENQFVHVVRVLLAMMEKKGLILKTHDKGLFWYRRLD